mmetsp:Transcript_133188/g.385349  ORF Transcript_133188/g.385349 Transcript_133188/m.385349 type:complete len:258 (+) Transcript_133188:76-849(+)
MTRHTHARLLAAQPNETKNRRGRRARLARRSSGCAVQHQRGTPRTPPEAPREAAGDAPQVRADDDADEAEVGREEDGADDPHPGRAPDGLVQDQVGVDTYHEHGQAPSEDLPSSLQHELAHEVPVRDEVEDGKEGEGKLHRLQDVQPLVHGVVEVGALGSQQCHDDSGAEGDGSRDQGPKPDRNVPLEEALHDILPREGAGHGGRLAGRQNAQGEELLPEAAAVAEERPQGVAALIEADLPTKPSEAALARAPRRPG